MNIKRKTFIVVTLISFFMSCVVEKIVYPFVGFDIIRALIVIGFTLLFEGLLFSFSSNKIKKILYNIVDNVFDYLKCFFIKNILSLNFLKIGFSIFVTLYVSLFFSNIYYFVIGISEVCLITLLSNFLILRKKKLGMLINNLLMLLYNSNVVVLMLGGTFVSFIMLSNVDSLEDLQGKTIVYVVWTILTIGFSFIPFRKINIKRKNNTLLIIGFLLYEVFLVLFLGVKYSPMCNYGSLISDSFSFWKMQMHVNNMIYKDNVFYKKDVEDFIKYDKSVGEKPNIILIFTEGLSSHIIYDQRNIMPNLNRFSTNCLNFSSYYNHTAATYRGIIGQLYSGYQLDNFDENHLISLQSILSSNGYDVYFINTEPYNVDFTKYLKSMKFDDVLVRDKTLGIADSISDKDAYKLLFDYAIDFNKNDKPFFLSVYTFGTHVSYDSVDEKYGTGADSFLNKFYDVDFQFGNFLDKFNNSELFDNTILIFTTDHATYTDYDYLKSFNGYYNRPHSFLDEIPLFIYHKNVDTKTVNVNGRNSLDLTPTILDYIDISGDNYFLGKSLFSNDDGTRYDTIFTEGTIFLSSKDEKLEKIDNDNDVIYEISGYLSLSVK